MQYRGVVEHGSGYAAKLGFPTINIPIDDASVSGIYAARVTIKDGETPYPAAAYADQKRKVLEAHLLRFNNDLTGMPVTIELVEKLRESKEFDSEAALREAIAQDVENVRMYFLKATS